MNVSHLHCGHFPKDHAGKETVLENYMKFEQVSIIMVKRWIPTLEEYGNEKDEIKKLHTKLFG
jgi:flavorubredoxin